MDGARADRDTCWVGDSDGSVLLCLHIVAEGGKRAETNKFDSRSGDIVDQGAETEGTDMSGMDGCSVGAGDRDRSRKLDGLEKILESVGYREGRTGVKYKGCEGWWRCY